MGWGPRHPSSGSGICVEVLCPPQAKTLPSLFLPIPSAVPGCEGWPGGRDPLPALSQGGKPPAQRCHRPCGIQQAPLLRDGEKFSRALSRLALSVGTSGRARRWQTLLLPVPALLRPSLRGRQECVAGTARLPPPARISPPHPAYRGQPDLPNAQCQEKEPPAPGRCRGNRDIGGHLSAERGESGQGKGEKCFREKF